VNPLRRLRGLTLSAVVVLSACSTEPELAILPLDVTADLACALDGMLIAQHDGPKAQELHFVVGSSRMGAMGPTLAPFRQASAAAEFVELHGGTVYRFDEIDTALSKQIRRQGIEHLTGH